MINKKLLIKYAEIHLKGQNRPYFQRLLVKRVKEALQGQQVKVYLHDSRIFVEAYQDEADALQRLARVFGIHAISPVVELPKDDQSLLFDTAVNMMQGLQGTFKVQARRADKRYPLTSPQLNAAIGGAILKQFPQLQVDVHQPDHLLHVEIRDSALLYVREVEGAGGLPTGSSGKASLLLSAGIDSPVAGYRIAKRGVQIHAVYFHSPPYTGDVVKDKVSELARVLSSHAGGIRLFVVPFTKIQQEIHQRCHPDYTTLLMRRSMMRIAELIAKKEGSQALITGESIGQVASQTLESLACTDQAVSLPVFRPLIGMDKLEIIREAERIGSYETSILPHEDCCTVFTPLHPVTKPKLADAIAAEEPLHLDDWLSKEEAVAASTAEILRIFSNTAE